MRRFRKRPMEEPDGTRIHPANRLYSSFSCLNCSRSLKTEPKLLNNEAVVHFCECGYMNKFTWDSSFNMIQTIYRTSITPEQYRKMPNLITD